MTVSITKTPRITKAMKFEALEAALKGEAIPYNLSAEDLLGFISSEKALLAKKNSADRKPTDAQKENEHLKALILEFLATSENGVTCTEIIKGIPEMSTFGTQKPAALLRQLIDVGKVEKTMVKGKALFSLV